MTVTSATLTSLSVTPTGASVPVSAGASAQVSALQLQMKATGFFSDGSTVDLTQSVSWSSGSHATVNPHKGLVTGNNVDPAVTITATVPWTSTSPSPPPPIAGSTTIGVTPAVLQSISLGTSPITMASGQTHQLVATPTYSDNTSSPAVTPTWSSSAPNTVSVDPNTGLAKALAAGGSLTLFANSPGAWGNTLQISVKPQTSLPARFSLLYDIVAGVDLEIREIREILDLDLRNAHEVPTPNALSKPTIEARLDPRRSSHQKGQRLSGITPTVRRADYVGSWVEVLRADDRAIVCGERRVQCRRHLLAFRPRAAS